MFKAKFLAPLALVCLPHMASALSCLPPDIRQGFQSADASDKSYFVVEGAFTLSDPDFAIPTGGDGMPAPVTQVDGALDGLALGPNGLTASFSNPVTFEIECMQTSCGQVETDKQVIAFVRQENDRLFVESGPCGGYVFVEPNDRDRKLLQQCLNGGPCQPDS